ncbi:MAG: ribosomal protein S18-alanine N-acetyltransferase [Oscillospiraceae bacterium]|nr:ribosomal protein S18-alanine N-acetyltransferase [Oscillospiraceae bacterium]
MMEYVLMTQEHIGQIAALEQENFSMPWSENAISAELKNPLSLWIVAVDRQKVVGYVGSQSVLGEADMMNLAVDAMYRRQGIGKQLVLSLIDGLAHNAVSKLTLEVRASNTAAISLYESLGFLQVGRRPNYYSGPKEDALILRKEWDV